MGQTGILRLFLPPLSKNASWLLPFGILGAILLLVKGVIARWSFKRNKPIKAEDLELDEAVSPEISALILWGGWLITGMAFFSIAQFFHEYYLSILGPPLAALVGIGAVQFWDLRKQSRWLTATLFITSIGGTIAYQLLTARLYISSVYWLPIALPLFGIGAVLWIATSPSNRLLQAGFTCLIAAMFVAPSLWSILTNAYPSENQSLPSVYSGQTGLAADQRGLNVNPKLLDYLESNTQSGSYLLAVPSSMQGSDYVIATGRPVLYLGGFMGIDQVVTTDQLAQRVQQGQLRFIYARGQRGGMGMGSQAKIFTWVSANCSVVPSFDAVTQNSGAPGGIGGSGNPAVSGSSRGFGSMQVSLYDCGSPN